MDDTSLVIHVSDAAAQWQRIIVNICSKISINNLIYSYISHKIMAVPYKLCESYLLVNNQ